MLDTPVSIWIDQLRQSDDQAAHKLWHHFISRLEAAAKNMLRPGGLRVYNDQDAAQSAFHSRYA